MLTRAQAFTVAGGAALYGGCALAGWWLTRHGAHLHLGSAYPLGGHYRLHLTPWLLPATGLGAAVLRWGPALAGRLSWPRLLGTAYATALGWAVTLALVAGPSAIAHPLTTRYEYLHDVRRVDAMGPGTFLRTFTWYIVDSGHGEPWTTHVSGHPPLATLVFVLLYRAGLTSSNWAAALVIAVGATAAPSVLATLRTAGGDGIARRAAPYVATAPAALWLATSADALFTGVAAAGLLALATGGRWRAALGGLALGACAFLSYGLVLLAPLAIAAVAVRRPPIREAVGRLSLAALGVAAVVAAFAAAGFWWFDGLTLVRERVVLGGAWQERPTGYFVFSNLATLAVSAGPATLAALPFAVPRWRSPVTWLPAAALAAVAAAIASNLSKGETERIYLPFAVWLPWLTGLLPDARRYWLAAQLGLGLLIAATTQLDW
jgi:hypothetical protein